MKKTYFELEGEIEFRKVFLSRIEELRRSSLSDAVTETKKEGGEMARILRLADFESEISAKIKKEGRRQRSRSRSGSRGRSSSATARPRRWDVAPLRQQGQPPTQSWQQQQVACKVPRRTWWVRMDRCWATPQVDKDSDKWQVCRGKGRGWVEKRWKMDLARLGQVPPRNVNDGGEVRGRREARRLEREGMEETLYAEDTGAKE